MLAESFWICQRANCKPSDVLCFKIETDLLLQFMDIIEDTIINQTRLISANFNCNLIRTNRNDKKFKLFCYKVMDMILIK